MYNNSYVYNFLHKKELTKLKRNRKGSLPTDSNCTKHNVIHINVQSTLCTYKHCAVQYMHAVLLDRSKYVGVDEVVIDVVVHVKET